MIPNIGGRFSGLTNVGLAAGARPRPRRGCAERRRARRDRFAAQFASPASGFAPAVGAAVAVGLAKERGVRANVMLPYSDRLSRFAAWYVQLWGESLGKGGEGTTPVAALGPVDQHSQLQLYLDGAPQHFITVIRERLRRAEDLASRPTSPSSLAPTISLVTRPATSSRRSSAPSPRP